MNIASTEEPAIAEASGLKPFLQGLAEFVQKSFGGNTFSAVSLADKNCQFIAEVFPADTLPEAVELSKLCVSEGLESTTDKVHQHIVGAELRGYYGVVIFEHDGLKHAIGFYSRPKIIPGRELSLAIKSAIETFQQFG